MVVVRVLFTAMPVWSHLQPLLPVARAMHAAGHDVLIATGSALAGELDGQGLPYESLPGMLVGQQFRAEPALAREIGLSEDGVPLPELAELPAGAGFGRLFAGAAAARAAADLRTVAADFRPHLIVRECTEFAGFLVAELLGVPCVTADVSPLAPSHHPALLPMLDRTRATLGLPALPGVAALARDPWLGWLPSDWWPAGARTPAHVHYRPPVPAAGEPLDPAVAALPADRPLVLAALGSNTGHMLGAGDSPLNRIVAAVGELPCTAVVALGAGVDPASWPGPRPDNVHLVSFVQQRLLLPACELFITHAGFGSVQEATAAGVPMVALPLYAEQPANAARLAELGVGVAVPGDVTTAELARACDRVLGEPAFRHAARGFQRRTLALPGMARLVEDLVALAGRDGG